MSSETAVGHWLLAEADRIPAEGPSAWMERIGREHEGEVDGLLRLLAAGPEDLRSETVLALRAVGAEVTRVDDVGDRLLFRVAPPGGAAVLVVAPDSPLPGEQGHRPSGSPNVPAPRVASKDADVIEAVEVEITQE